MFNKLTKSYLINSLVDVHDLLFTHPDLKKNIELKDKYNNERIFILGSGSSILLYDLKVLSNECVMTQNSFHMHHDISDINPTFHFSRVHVPRRSYFSANHRSLVDRFLIYFPMFYSLAAFQ